MNKEYKYIFFIGVKLVLCFVIIASILWGAFGVFSNKPVVIRDNETLLEHFVNEYKDEDKSYYEILDEAYHDEIKEYTSGLESYYFPGNDFVIEEGDYYIENTFIRFDSHTLTKIATTLDPGEDINIEIINSVVIFDTTLDIRIRWEEGPDMTTFDWGDPKDISTLPHININMYNSVLASTKSQTWKDGGRFDDRYFSSAFYEGVVGYYYDSYGWLSKQPTPIVVSDEPPVEYYFIRTENLTSPKIYAHDSLIIWDFNSLLLRSYIGDFMGFGKDARYGLLRYGLLYYSPLLEWTFSDSMVTGYGSKDSLYKYHDLLKGKEIGKNAFLDIAYV